MNKKNKKKGSSQYTYPTLPSSVNQLQSQLLTNQRLPYTSGGSARGVYLKHYE